MDLSLFDTHESSVRGYIRSFPTVFEKAVGSIITAKDGTPYIDFFSGAGGLNYGHNHPAIKQAMIDYLSSDGIIHGLDMATSAKSDFIQAFTRTILRPRKLDYKLQFTGPTGTNAVEAALKLARLVTGKRNIIAFTHAFHGVSLGALATTANSWFRNASGVELGNVTFVPYEGYIEGLDSIHYLETLLDDASSGIDSPAAIIVEAIQGEGGVNAASDEWLQRLRALATARDILLIVDDIQAGCGRSGTFFSFESSGIVPDMITMSKSLSASGLPMSLLLIKPDHDQWKPGQHNGTFRGNNLAFVSAAAAINTFWADDSLEKEIAKKSAIMSKSLSEIAARYPDLSTRGRGMFQGLVFSAHPERASLACKEAFARGLIIEVSGAQDEVIKLLPALTINDKELKKGLAIISESVDAVMCEKA